jgi:polygalacturonase
VYLESGSTVKGSPRLEDYRAIGSETGLITANGAQNIALVGRGTIDGNSLAFVDAGHVLDLDFGDKKRTRQGEDYMSHKFGTQDGPFVPKERPGKMIQITHCEDVMIAGVTIQNSPFWTIAVSESRNVNLMGIRVNALASDLRIPNDDGTDVTNCANIHISDCDYQTGDDCLALFGVENMTVTNCTLRSRSSAIRVGYAEGHIRNVTFSNIAIHDSNRGINVNVRTDGVIENVLFENITIQTRLSTGNWWGKAEPIHISAMPKAGVSPGAIRNLRFSNIVAEGENGILISGFKDCILRNLQFDGLRLKVQNGPLVKAYGGNFDFRGTDDPATDIYQHDIPALYARFVNGLKIRNFEVEWDEAVSSFFSHGIECEDVGNILIDGFEGKQAHTESGHSAINLSNCSEVTIRNSIATRGTQTFLAHSGIEGNNLFVNNNLIHAKAGLAPANASFTTFGNLEPGHGGDPQADSSRRYTGRGASSRIQEK